MRRPGIKEKIAFILVVPLMVELYFLCTLMSSLSDISRERVIETRTVEILAGLNTVLNDIAMCGYVMLFNPKGELLPNRYETLLGDAEILKRKVRDAKGGLPESPNLTDFLSSLDKLTEACSAYEVSRVRDVVKFGMVGAAQTQSWNITQAGEEAIKEQSELQETHSQLANHKEDVLRQTIMFTTFGTIGIALLALLYISLEFGRAFDILMKNTARIKTGEPLLPLLSGKDELSRLDAMIHGLSDEIKQARKQERALIENSVVVICSLDARMDILEISNAVEHTLGVRPYELVGDSLYAIVHPQEKLHAEKSFARSRELITPTVFELRLRIKKRKTIFTEWTVQWSEAEQKYFCAVQDISVRKNAEKFKAEIYAMVSHDLRSPLSSMLVSFDMMSQGLAGDLNSEGMKLVHRSKVQISSLMTLINDLVDAERFQSEAFKPSFQVVRIKTLVDENMVGVQDAIRQKDLHLTTEIDDVDVRADSHHIGRAITVLLKNTIARSPRSGKVKIEFKQRLQHGTKRIVEFRIEDFGPRLTAEEKDHTFSRFSLARKETGSQRELSRFSMAIARAIVEAHDGEIGLDTNPHGATTFWFKIPLR